MSANPSTLTVLTSWPLQPSVLLGVALTAWIYIEGLRTLAVRSQHGQTVLRRHVAYFALGLLAVVVALESPIDVLSNQLLSVHMIQHLLLLMVAPPLLLLGKPIPVLVVGAPRSLTHWLGRSHARTRWLRTLTSILTLPLVAYLLFFGFMLAWHLPAFYDAALQNAAVHLLEHVCFFATGILFWWVIIQPGLGRPRLAHGWRLLYVFAAMVPGSFLGLLFIFTSTPLYPFYAGLPRLWGISVLDDQDLAGSLMLVAGDAILACALIPLFIGAMERLEQIEQSRFAQDELSS